MSDSRRILTSLRIKKFFPKIFKNGGFDIIIGNLPHGAKLSKEERNFFSKNTKLYSNKIHNYVLRLQEIFKKVRF